MANQLVDYLERNNLPDNKYDGFIKNKSVVTAAAEFHEPVIDSVFGYKGDG